jgi:hypothetical protein
MNNLIVIALAGAAGLALFANSQRHIAEADSTVTSLQLRASAAKEAADSSQVEMRRLEKLFVSDQQSIEKLRSTLAIEKQPYTIL